MAHRLLLNDIRIRLKEKVLLSLNAEIGPGEVLTVMGPSGSGKSTLLAFVAGFLDPIFSAQGNILLDGEDVTSKPAEARHIGLLFQDPLLFPHLSVGGNLLFGMDRRTPNRKQRMCDALAEAGLQGFEQRDTATLSGGQKARVALLRVLLSEPRAVLLDEPFSKLDQSLRDDLRRLVFARLRQAGLPALLVTHDAADAQATGGPVVELAEH
ncbi:ATP-binding cassette domain-containing protein [Limibacillus sp. MBR-115]|jgi:putative thiamine transport system ATP-binding protein|uniref:ATP-binding cassette domain-containing protein n=1 Tax=Limibacillus sp. MBR-115 TaxID=3156465 RepID=UPI0033919C5B